MAKSEKPTFTLDDLRNLELSQITNILIENQNILIKSALVIVFLILVGVMFNDHRIKEQNLRTQMSQLQDKLNAIKARDAAVAGLDNFENSLPSGINEFELINLISNYARSYHVSIPSLSPAESKDMGLYDLLNIDFRAVSDNFKDMMFFLRKIEKSKYPLRIDSWSGSQGENGEITFDIKISAVLIHS